MKKVLMLLFLMIVITGCSNGDQEQGTRTDPFIGGVKGIDVNFAEGSPPKEVYDGGSNPFEVSVTLKNKGEYTVTSDNVLVTLSGILPSEFGVSESELKKHPEEDLLATEKNAEGGTIEGPQVYVTFDDLNRQEELDGNKQYPIRADVCYLYQTTAVADICVRENNLETTKEGVCSVNEPKVVYNSGAPVHITDFKEYPRARNKVGFTFKVTHVGSGEIFKKETECSKEQEVDENKVWLEISSELGSGLKCSGLSEGDDTSGYVRLYDRTHQVSCTQEVSTQSDYQTPIRIKATYDYEEEQTANVLVKHAVS
ncbi:MAG: hypothetical protein R6V53_00630 [Candidatus Woesearchaeota archaeon]